MVQLCGRPLSRIGEIDLVMGPVGCQIVFRQIFVVKLLELRGLVIVRANV
jgi:hypothetical protein